MTLLRSKNLHVSIRTYEGKLALRIKVVPLLVIKKRSQEFAPVTATNLIIIKHNRTISTQIHILMILNHLSTRY